ncbi:hypothetical protein KSP35_20655 [Aquihabitans sp. G128]|uniref:hypothetical protein n=1 Tax=Aquihabitans sp. G128 TaxID=2849779 RepID=UPI001C234DA0|nr:hypothetical protein [Aquihabitans sp. G128]QXC60704.1 hypothetical protein KSP35_20655 [Aquihabitans sp. G128]
MKNRTRSLVATAVVALVAFGGVTAASAFGAGGETPVEQQPAPVDTRANGTSIPVQREFVSVAPCRIADTRSASAGKLQPGQPRLITVAGTSAFPAQGGHAGGCGVPSNAAAAVVSLTSTQAAGAGYLRAWAFGGSEPTATVLNWTKLGGGGITTGATVPINGGMDIKGFGKATDIVIDVTGYYVEPIAAVISSGGNLGSHSSTVTSASRDSLGAYTVNFSQNMEGCAIQVTAETSFYSGGSEIIGNHAAIYLRNVTAAGAYGDTNFSLTVTC